MKKAGLLLMLFALVASCGERSREKKEASSSDGKETVFGKSIPGDSSGPLAGAILIARDIVTEVVIRPDPEGDPWEIEKVAGFTGDPLVDGIFNRIYDGSLTVYDYHSGGSLSPADVKKIEDEFKNDRTKIGKLSFTEDWYYYPEENRLVKKAKSVTFGYELYNNEGKVYAYRAAFRADLH